jgi:RND family efflux transporter MFP subunit
MAEQLNGGSLRGWPVQRFWYLLGVLAVLGAGVGIFVYLVKTKRGPSGESDAQPMRTVRVFEAARAPHRVAVTAYGQSRASERWTAIAEVAGRVIEVHTDFEPGEILPEGMLLVKIDPTDYKLAESRFEADQRAKQTQLRELDQTEANLKDILTLQQRQLVLAEAEYKRLQEVRARDVASLSALQAAESSYVGYMTSVRQTQNSLSLLPVQRDLATAALDAATAQLAQARRDLAECDIRLPFAARCAEKSIEVNQFVAIGERLGTFLDRRLAEVVVMFETRKVPHLFPGGVASVGTMDLTQATPDKSIVRRMRIPVEVRWGLNERTWTWYGRVARIGSSLDPGTRTLPVIVEVPNPYKDIQPGVRPPLLPDVFCEVTAYGATLDDVVVIPRDALRDGRVYLLRNGALHIQPVTVAALEEDLAVVSAGIETGDQVILADVFPASEGMPLAAEVVPNPVKPRGKIDFPAEIFDQPEAPEPREAMPREPASGEPARGEPPIGEPAPREATTVAVHGDCPDFRGGASENGTVPLGSEEDRHIFRPAMGRKMSQSPAWRLPTAEGVR